MFSCDLAEKIFSRAARLRLESQPDITDSLKEKACPEKIEMTAFGYQNIQTKDESGTRKMHDKTARKSLRHCPMDRLDGVI